ncbi:uncharacterized protein EV422DRAFT_135570 [Fimicolochytrium jonesii]|uniref:uncharacterized protein n=1 Tax=Fimicolochytrium jonesii TaxID=1396493 RepID=UPI0022FDFA02|nr:uncharacterized protein EV422DRAFT_135570 [Fimicolochytrium jonesii]KAI8825652.1 hypothetical protein EV422DRAFT_135570 [Fimicolochytrium jonesii]
MYASLALLAPLLATLVAAAPAAPATAAASAPATPSCVADWTIYQNKDLKDLGDLKSHPAYKKKFNSACECGNAVNAVTSPEAAFFVWNTSTKECFPKGMTPFDQENEQILSLGWQTSANSIPAQRGLLGTDAQLAKVCKPKFRVPGDWSNTFTACSEICKNNYGIEGCDFAITVAGHAGQTWCDLCSYGTNQGQVLGARTKW